MIKDIFIDDWFYYYIYIQVWNLNLDTLFINRKLILKEKVQIKNQNLKSN